ncbi:hypothetical protein GALMADRAFT_230857 [Galerina marginata CBS 339.88]|uniref:Uncharacterized protein n=1 Tax=Galerina marginata (strain CBS 339.88) TaxID=685588 RepID=A0A067SGA0_GALM3|nr:hypothetical protein GALMADRAFT_230857 [Galerina marginata CBS 339.88]
MRQRLRSDCSLSAATLLPCLRTSLPRFMTHSYEDQDSDRPSWPILTPHQLQPWTLARTTPTQAPLANPSTA